MFDSGSPCSKGHQKNFLATHALRSNANHELLSSFMSSYDVRYLCNVMQCFYTFRILSHKLPSHGTGPRRRRLCLHHLWWPLHGSKPSITWAPGACATPLKPMWESCSGTSSPTNSEVIMQLFIHMCVCVRTQRHTHTQTHMCRQTQAHDAHGDTDMRRPAVPHRNMQTHRHMETCRHMQTGTHTAYTQCTLFQKFLEQLLKDA